VIDRLALYAVTAPGLEPLTARELERLGISPSATEPGGVTFAGSLAEVARANLWLRTASRVLVRLGSFHARALGELERKAARLSWGDWLPPTVSITVRVTCRKSRLFHQRAVAERILAASGAPGAISPADEAEDSDDQSQLIVVRLFRDECTVSLDSSGALLHRRGYRLATAKAPLRETLAAGLVLASGWRPSEPLVDPFCGSGTIPIEAALLARRIPPGARRDFGFRRWSCWDDSRWQGLVDVALGETLARAPAPIVGADRDAGAVTAARTNAERAGVAGDIEFRNASLSALDAPPGPGALVSNPPYGVRVGERGRLRDLYARLGQVAQARLPGWRLTLLVPAAPLERATGLDFTPCLRTRSGGLSVRVVRSAVPSRGPEPDSQGHREPQGLH
jgi:putative N6-adenine-specific DNA methylase